MRRFAVALSLAFLFGGGVVTGTGTSDPLHACRTVISTVYSTIVSTIVSTVVSTTTVTVTAPPPPNGFFSASSFINTPLPAVVQIDPNSATWLAQLQASESYGMFTNWQFWTPTVYSATASTPAATFTIANDQKQITIPFQPSWVPSAEADHNIVVIDGGCGYEFEALDLATMTATGEATFHVSSGSGMHANDAGIDGGDFSYLAGMILPGDIASGAIRHALRYATPISAPGFVSPANRSDGTHVGGIPEGQLLRLDPALNLSTFGLTAYQMMVARALQTYGAYESDTSGSFTLYAENTLDGSTYAQQPLPLPWSVASHLQFLSSLGVSPLLDTNSDVTCSQQH